MFRDKLATHIWPTVHLNCACPSPPLLAASSTMSAALLPVTSGSSHSGARTFHLRCCWKLLETRAIPHRSNTLRNGTKQPRMIPGSQIHTPRENKHLTLLSWTKTKGKTLNQTETWRYKLRVAQTCHLSVNDHEFMSVSKWQERGLVIAWHWDRLNVSDKKTSSVFKQRQADCLPFSNSLLISASKWFFKGCLLRQGRVVCLAFFNSTSTKWRISAQFSSHSWGKTGHIPSLTTHLGPGNLTFGCFPFIKYPFDSFLTQPE